MKKSIAVIDYIGNHDSLMQPSGHLLTVIQEYMAVLSSKFSCELIVTENYSNYLNGLHPAFTLNDIPNGLAKRAIARIKFSNIKKSLKANSKTLFFINPDFYLFIYLATHHVDKKIVIINYIDYSSANFLKKTIFKMAFRKITLQFVTFNPNCCSKKSIFVPDFSYDLVKFRKYETPFSNKKKEVLFCGTISEAKDVMGLINAFNRNKRRLTICGKFSSSALYNNALDSANSENITIIDKRLSNEEYYRMLSQYLFVVLPYKKSNYNNRSSGVVLETIFLDSIPIGPSFLFENLKIAAIAYNNVEELSSFSEEKLDESLLREIINKNNTLKQKYNKEDIMTSILERLLSL